MPKLTKRIIDLTPRPPHGQRFLRDSQLPGFALRLTTGSKTFVLEKRINGRNRRITLGHYGVLTVEQARKKAVELSGDISAGKDPAQARQDRIKEPTFKDLADIYLERHAIHKKSCRNDISFLNRYLNDWKSRKLSAIARGDVALLHARIGALGHPYQANRMVALVRTMFNLAGDWGLYRGENPARRLRMFKEVKRDRFVKPEEMPRLFKALAEEANRYIRTAFLVSLLTGARRTEVLQMRREDVDIDRALWRLPETKAGRPHVIPLPGPVCTLLAQLSPAESNPYYFVGRGGRGYLMNITRAWKRIRQRARIEDVRIHDLRRTLGSWLALKGESLSLIGKVLNHSQLATTQIYARLSLDPVREALEQNATNMLTVAGVRSELPVKGPHEISSN